MIKNKNYNLLEILNWYIYFVLAVTTMADSSEASRQDANEKSHTGKAFS